MKRMIATAALLAAMLCVPGRAEEPAVLSPAVQKAVKDLSAEEFAVRQKALKTLQASVAAQLRELATVDDAEAQQRMVALLEFQDAMTRWAIEAMHLPAEQRGKVLDWGLKPEVTVVIAKAYGTTVDKRVEGIKELGGREEGEASWLLARMIGDERREVYLAAMDAVYDRKPSEEIVSALWQRLEGGLTPYRSAATAAMMFRGRAVPVDSGMVQNRTGDSEAATDTLVHLNSELVSEKIKKLLAAIDKEPDKYPNIGSQLMPYNETGRSLMRLMETYKSPESMAFLFTLVDRDVSSRQGVTINGKTLFISNRTLPMLTLLSIAGQKPEDYALTRTTGIWSLQWCAGSEKEEADAIAAFKTWYSKHKDEVDKKGKP